MCGRYEIRKPKAVRKHFRVDDSPVLFDARYNVAPTQSVPVVRLGAERRRELALLRWGLIPAWSEVATSQFSEFNARAETLAKRRLYRSAFRKRRYLMPAMGFYEWRAWTPRQPFHIGLRDESPFAFAALWGRWHRDGAEPVESCALITDGPNELVEPIHNRMPVILDPEDYDR